MMMMMMFHHEYHPLFFALGIHKQISITCFTSPDADSLP